MIFVFIYVVRYKHIPNVMSLQVAVFISRFYYDPVIDNSGIKKPKYYSRVIHSLRNLHLNLYYRLNSNSSKYSQTFAFIIL